VWELALLTATARRGVHVQINFEQS